MCRRYAMHFFSRMDTSEIIRDFFVSKADDVTRPKRLAYLVRTRRGCNILTFKCTIGLILKQIKKNELFLYEIWVLKKIVPDFYARRYIFF